jgi:PilZ domain
MAQAMPQNEYDLRRAARHRADFAVIVENKRHGDQPAHIVNISAHGFMTDDNILFEQGDRVELRLPHIGRIEAHLLWTVENRAGFQFERVVRVPEFLAMLEIVAAKLR